MTTAIYFLLMSLSLFVVPQLLVRFTLGYPVWDKRVRPLFYAGALPILWHPLPCAVFLLLPLPQLEFGFEVMCGVFGPGSSNAVFGHLFDPYVLSAWSRSR